MNAKNKTGLVIISTLLIGIVIGTIGSTLFRRHLWDERKAHYQTTKGFTERMIHIIKPDPGQIPQLEKIIIGHHDKFENISSEFRDKVKVNTDSLLNELRPVLNDEQFERLKKSFDRRNHSLRKRHSEEEKEKKEAD
ncbi:MAG: hypothetical protein E4H13_14710 [Calditrichales bacterium]|nr:MAG: hypothetical protein E4H13_14710 [Calditrichales bacterium]